MKRWSAIDNLSKGWHFCEGQPNSKEQSNCLIWLGNCQKVECEECLHCLTYYKQTRGKTGESNNL